MSARISSVIPRRCGLSTDTVHRLLKLGDIVLTNALIFLGGHDHGNIAVLAADKDGLALGGVEKGCEPLFSICSGYRSHLSSLDEVDKIGQTSFLLQSNYTVSVLHCSRVIY